MHDFDTIAPGQVCRICSQPYEGNHDITPLGAVRCLRRAFNAGLVPWWQHGFMTPNGHPYLSLMEQVGAIAVLLEGDGLPDASRVVLRHLAELTARVEARTPAPPHRIAPADMPRLLRAPFPDIPLGLYSHHKGDRYTCLGGGLRATGFNEEIQIAYVPYYPNNAQYYLALRTRADWLEPVKVGEGMRPRFQLIEPWSVKTAYDYLSTVLYMGLSPVPGTPDPEPQAREDPRA
jgi:hypothetical protein